jgi:hypothetical protein
VVVVSDQLQTNGQLNVTFTPSSSQATGFWPDAAGGVSIADLQPYIGAGNPPY